MQEPVAAVPVRRLSWSISIHFSAINSSAVEYRQK